MRATARQLAEKRVIQLAAEKAMDCYKAGRELSGSRLSRVLDRYRKKTIPIDALLNELLECHERCGTLGTITAQLEELERLLNSN